MTIEFADPGYNWGFVWWAVGLFVLGVFLFLLPFWVSDNVEKIGAWPVLGMIVFVAGPSLTLGLSAGDYNTRVRAEQTAALNELGFSNVAGRGDRFTAATEDGQYFEGVLVDLRPDEGYAYEVLELNRTGD